MSQLSGCLPSAFDVEIAFQFLLGRTIVVVDVADDLTVLQQGDARTDIDRVVEVVAGDEDGGTRLAVVVGEQVLDGILRTGIEEVEGFVEDEQAGVHEEGRHDAHLLLVAGREVADELLLSQDFSGHEVLILAELLLQLRLAEAADACDELQVFLGREVVDDEGIIDVGTCPVLPFLRLGHIDGAALVFDGHAAAVGLDEVEDEAEERALARSVVAYETQDLAFMDDELINIYGGLLAESLLDVAYVDGHGFVSLEISVEGERWGQQLFLVALNPSMFW